MKPKRVHPAMDVAGGSIRAVISQWELTVWRQYQHVLDKWTPLVGRRWVDPEILDNEGPTLPSSVNDEFRPLRLPPPQVQVLVETGVAALPRLGEGVFPCGTDCAAWVETGAAALPSFHAALTVLLGVETGAVALPRLGDGVVSGEHMQKFWPSKLMNQ
ncbi:hypothetical protein ACSQ67_019732 [Phaseolus vulgaris]